MERGRRFCGECGAEAPASDAAPSSQTTVEPTFSDATRPFSLAILRGGQPVRQARDSRPPLKLVGTAASEIRNAPQARSPRPVEPRREGALALAQEPDPSPAETTGEIARAEVLRLRPQSSGESVRPSDAPRPPVRPPVLASEALLEDIEPTEPGARGARLVIAVLGLGGAAAALAADLSIHGAAVGAAMAAAGAIGLAPMRYGVRGIAASVVAFIGLGLAARTRLAFGSSVDTVVLPFVCSVLAGGLLVRGYYRASRAARALVAVGVVLGGAWLFGSGALAGLTRLDLAWQSWLPALLRGGFILVLLLSLLAFMEPTTGAGCKLWGATLALWYAAYVATELAVRSMPAGEPMTVLSGQELAAVVASGALTAIAAVGLLSAVVGLIGRRPLDA